MFSLGSEKGAESDTVTVNTPILLKVKKKKNGPSCKEKKNDYIRDFYEYEL